MIVSTDTQSSRTHRPLVATICGVILCALLIAAPWVAVAAIGGLMVAAGVAATRWPRWVRVALALVGAVLLVAPWLAWLDFTFGSGSVTIY